MVGHHEIYSPVEHILEFLRLFTMEMYDLHSGGMGGIGILLRPRTRQLQVLALVLF